MSFLTQSHQVFFRRPLCLIPSTSHVIQRLTQSLSLVLLRLPDFLNRLTVSKKTGWLVNRVYLLSYSMELFVVLQQRREQRHYIYIGREHLLTWSAVEQSPQHTGVSRCPSVCSAAAAVTSTSFDEQSPGAAGRVLG